MDQCIVTENTDQWLNANPVALETLGLVSLYCWYPPAQCCAHPDAFSCFLAEH